MWKEIVIINSSVFRSVEHLLYIFLIVNWIYLAAVELYCWSIIREEKGKNIFSFK